MADLDFPLNPPVDQVYVGTNDIVYIYDGVKWNANYSPSTLWTRDETTSTISPVDPDDKLSVQTYVIEDLGDL